MSHTSSETRTFTPKSLRILIVALVIVISLQGIVAGGLAVADMQTGENFC